MSEPNRKDGVSEEVSPASSRPTHSEDGVDLTLIRWMLSRTPLERLQVLQGFIRMVRKLRDANPSLR